MSIWLWKHVERRQLTYSTAAKLVHCERVWESTADNDWIFRRQYTYLLKVDRWLWTIWNGVFFEKTIMRINNDHDSYDNRQMHTNAENQTADLLSARPIHWASGNMNWQRWPRVSTWAYFPLRSDTTIKLIRSKKVCEICLKAKTIL